MKRILCHLFGCGANNDGHCPRCGEHMYESADHIQRGVLFPFSHRWWRAQRWLRRCVIGKCEVCGKRMWFSPRVWTCSDACYQEWLPF